MAKEVQLNSSAVIVAVTFAAATAAAIATDHRYCFLYKGPPDLCCCTHLVISIQFILVK